MAVQESIENTTNQLLLSGDSFVKNSIIAQDAARTEDLLQNTVMAYDTANENWVPFTALTDTDGQSVPQAIYVGSDIEAANLVAGDIENVAILIGGGCTVDESLVVWDQDLQTSASIISAAAANPFFVVTAESCLRIFGIYFEATEAISGFEN